MWSSNGWKLPKFGEKCKPKDFNWANPKLNKPKEIYAKTQKEKWKNCQRQNLEIEKREPAYNGMIVKKTTESQQ